MAKKEKAKELGVGGPNIPTDNTALNRQVENGDSITIADVKQFIVDAKKKQEDYKTIADRSWNEIEKRNKLGKLYGGGELDRAKRWTKFPLWWSCWKIRQPITLARLAIPVLKDTQGDDPFGRTACVIGERFVKGILKTFEAFPEFSASNDDFLVTNFGWGRWYYRSTQCQEEEKVRLQVQQQQPPPPQLGPDGQPMPDQGPPQQLPPLFITPQGEQVDPSQVQEDDLGPYLLTGQMISVDNEEVYFEAGPYAGLLVEPDITRWNKATRIAFEQPYNYPEFKEKFGQEALDKLIQTDIQEHKNGKKPIMVYEYHDRILEEVRWFADNSEDFFQPMDMQDTDVQNLKEVTQSKGLYDHSDLYGLAKFFPCTEPLIINQSTRSFWPTPEFFQVQDIIDDISSIVTRMLQLTRAIRIRFLFDSSVRELKSLIGENWANGEGTGMGIPNLAQSLMNSNGSLTNLVAYFPVEELMKGLQGMYVAYEQRLNMFYNITGFSDLIRGQTSDSDKTYGERQLEGKFALNRMEPYQRKVQEWIKDNYQLGMEMGLKMFSDDTIDEYITPQTLDPEDKQRYVGALELLKDNRRGRFHIDFETDSTISINQEWKKTQAIETANAITKMMESVANTAQQMPELADAELRIMKHTVSELTDGKLFIDEITDAIQKTIDKVNEPKQPQFNKDEEQIKLDTRKQEFLEQKTMTEDRLTQMQMQMTDQINQAKLAQSTQFEQLNNQLDQFKIQSDNQMKMEQLAQDSQTSQQDLQLQYQKINADITATREKLANERDGLLIELRKIADKKEVDQFQGMIDAKAQETESVLSQMQLQLEQTQTALKAHSEAAQQARLDAQEMRLEREHYDTLHASHFDKLHTLVETAIKHQQLTTPVVTTAIQDNTGIATPAKKRVSTVVRDKNNDIQKIIHEGG